VEAVASAPDDIADEVVTGGDPLADDASSVIVRVCTVGASLLVRALLLAGSLSVGESTRYRPLPPVLHLKPMLFNRSICFSLKLLFFPSLESRHKWQNAKTDAEDKMSQLEHFVRMKYEPVTWPVLQHNYLEIFEFLPLKNRPKAEYYEPTKAF